ncbi:MAG: 3-phosphoshikimate 1-carboxyvinyltransferase [Phycisphaerales bacterium]
MCTDLTKPLASLPDPLPIPVVERPFGVAIRPPGSKSLTNRALLLAAMADGTSTLRGALTDADDAEVMIAALRRLGAAVETDGTTVTVTGVAGRWRIRAGEEVRLDLHNAGTATRFLTAAALLAPEGTSVVIDGDARMRERPIEELVNTLNIMAEDRPCAEYLGREGFPPVRIRPDHAAWVSGMVQSFGRTQSSQFISAVLMLGPFLPYGLTFRFSTPDITSRSYVEMTLSLMSRLGVEVTPPDALGERTIRPSRPTLPAFDLEIEPDASGATYFEAAAAMVPGASVTIEGLDLHPSRPSLQGDTRFVRVLTDMGAAVERLNRSLRITGPASLRAIDADLSDMPDTAMTAAVLACFAEGTTTLRGLRTLRVKETDRLAALQTELAKLGATVEIFKHGDDEGLRISPPSALGPRPSSLAFSTYNDHRMAMALALVGLRTPGVMIQNPACVAKTYPTFWRDLAKLYG